MTIFEFRRYRQTAAVSVLTLLAGCAQAADINIFNGDSFESAAEALQPGDTLIVHEGTYIDAGRISISVVGTAANPVLIKGADGENRPLITRSSGDTAQNTINIEGASYLTIEGLEISSNGGDGVNLNSNPSYITLRDLVVHDISVGINLRSSMHHIVVQHNQIYNTNDTGEGLYVGCHAGDCAVSDSVFEYNWIHDTKNAEQGDGIEIKRGSYSNIIRDNVIHDTNYPCLLLYGTDGNPRNIVERNVVWNCGDAAIQVAADTIVRNNIFLASGNRGFASQSHAGVNPGNLEITHNTFVGGSPCIYTSNWSNASNMVFANNAVYCASSNYSLSGFSVATVSGNVFEPLPSSISSVTNMAGRSEQQDFVDAGNRDVYPTQDSPLLSGGDSTYIVVDDFNGTARSAGVDAGAYTWTSTTNPGWIVTSGFKGEVPAQQPPSAPTLSFTVDSDQVQLNASTTLRWVAMNATTCEASGGWSGQKTTQGSETTGPLATDARFTLECMGSGGNIAKSVNVTLTSTTPATDVPKDSGGGALDWILTLFLLLCRLSFAVRKVPQ